MIAIFDDLKYLKNHFSTQATLTTAKLKVPKNK